MPQIWLCMCVVGACEPAYLAEAGMLVLSGANQFLDRNVLHPTHDAPVHLQSTAHLGFCSVGANHVR